MSASDRLSRHLASSEGLTVKVEIVQTVPRCKISDSMQRVTMK